MFFYRAALGIAFFLLAGCGGSKPASEIAVFTAASGRESMERIGAAFQARTGVRVAVTLGPSSTLARQIEQGADADLFLSANEAWADYLAERQRVESRRDLLGNRLVVVTPKDSSLHLKKLEDLAGPAIHRLALAEKAVPAGRYARQALTKIQIWKQVEGRVVSGVDVRGTLAYVARGEADAGLVYVTDAMHSNQVRIALTVPSHLHQPIRYPIVLIRKPHIQTAARQFLDYLRTDEAAAVFRDAGFETIQK